MEIIAENGSCYLSSFSKNQELTANQNLVLQALLSSKPVQVTCIAKTGAKLDKEGQLVRDIVEASSVILSGSF